MSDRKLASIQRIKAIHPIPGADRIAIAEVQGWNVIIQKSEFSVGDYCVYFEIDSILPDTDENFHFLTRRSENKEKWADHRLKTIKMRGVMSQGLCIPISAFQHLRPSDDRRR